MSTTSLLPENSGFTQLSNGDALSALGPLFFKQSYAEVYPTSHTPTSLQTVANYYSGKSVELTRRVIVQTESYRKWTFLVCPVSSTEFVGQISYTVETWTPTIADTRAALGPSRNISYSEETRSYQLSQKGIRAEMEVDTLLNSQRGPQIVAAAKDTLVATFIKTLHIVTLYSILRSNTSFAADTLAYGNGNNDLITATQQVASLFCPLHRHPNRIYNVASAVDSMRIACDIPPAQMIVLPDGGRSLIANSDRNFEVFRNGGWNVEDLKDFGEDIVSVIRDKIVVEEKITKIGDAANKEIIDALSSLVEVGSYYVSKPKAHDCISENWCSEKGRSFQSLDMSGKVKAKEQSFSEMISADMHMDHSTGFLDYGFLHDLCNDKNFASNIGMRYRTDRTGHAVIDPYIAHDAGGSAHPIYVFGQIELSLFSCQSLQQYGVVMNKIMRRTSSGAKMIENIEAMLMLLQNNASTRTAFANLYASALGELGFLRQPDVFLDFKPIIPIDTEGRPYSNVGGTRRELDAPVVFNTPFPPGFNTVGHAIYLIMQENTESTANWISRNPGSWDILRAGVNSMRQFFKILQTNFSQSDAVNLIFSHPVYKGADTSDPEVMFAMVCDELFGTVTSTAGVPVSFTRRSPFTSSEDSDEEEEGGEIQPEDPFLKFVQERFPGAVFDKERNAFITTTQEAVNEEDLRKDYDNMRTSFLSSASEATLQDFTNSYAKNVSFFESSVGKSKDNAGLRKTEGSFWKTFAHSEAGKDIGLHDLSSPTQKATTFMNALTSLRQNQRQAAMTKKTLNSFVDLTKQPPVKSSSSVSKQAVQTALKTLEERRKQSKDTDTIMGSASRKRGREQSQSRKQSQVLHNTGLAYDPMLYTQGGDRFFYPINENTINASKLENLSKKQIFGSYDQDYGNSIQSHPHLVQGSANAEMYESSYKKSRSHEHGSRKHAHPIPSSETVRGFVNSFPGYDDKKRFINETSNATPVQKAFMRILIDTWITQSILQSMNLNDLYIPIWFVALDPFIRFRVAAMLFVNRAIGETKHAYTNVSVDFDSNVKKAGLHLTFWAGSVLYEPKAVTILPAAMYRAYMCGGNNKPIRTIGSNSHNGRQVNDFDPENPRLRGNNTSRFIISVLPFESDGIINCPLDISGPSFPNLTQILDDNARNCASTQQVPGMMFLIRKIKGNKFNRHLNTRPTTYATIQIAGDNHVNTSCLQGWQYDYNPQTGKFDIEVSTNEGVQGSLHEGAGEAFSGKNYYLDPTGITSETHT